MSGGSSASGYMLVSSVPSSESRAACIFLMSSHGTMIRARPSVSLIKRPQWCFLHSVASNLLEKWFFQTHELIARGVADEQDDILLGRGFRGGVFYCGGELILGVRFCLHVDGGGKAIGETRVHRGEGERSTEDKEARTAVQEGTANSQLGANSRRYSDGNRCSCACKGTVEKLFRSTHILRWDTVQMLP